MSITLIFDEPFSGFDPINVNLLKQEILKVLADVRVAVRDWPKMREKMREARDLLEFGPAGVDEELRAESQQLLEWMVNNHFTFLGYREYKLSYRKDKIFLRPVKGRCALKFVKMMPEQRRRWVLWIMGKPAGRFWVSGLFYTAWAAVVRCP